MTAEEIIALLESSYEGYASQDNMQAASVAAALRTILGQIKGTKD